MPHVLGCVRLRGGESLSVTAGKLVAHDESGCVPAGTFVQFDSLTEGVINVAPVLDM